MRVARCSAKPASFTASAQVKLPARGAAEPGRRPNLRSQNADDIRRCFWLFLSDFSDMIKSVSFEATRTGNQRLETNMQLALRPYIIAGAAIAGAGIIVLTPATPHLPDVQVPAVQPAGSEMLDFRDFNVQDLLGALANSEGATSAPDTQLFDAPYGSIDLGGLVNPSITTPDPGPLDLHKLEFGAPASP